MVTDSGRDTTEQGRHLGTSLSETENVVDEQKHVLALLVTEVFGNGETSESDTGTGTRGLVHLTENESDLGVTVEVDDTGLNHFVVQIVTLTGTLTDTCHQIRKRPKYFLLPTHRRKWRNHRGPWRRC